MSLWFVAQALQLAASRLFSTLGFGGRFIGGTRADMSVGSASKSACATGVLRARHGVPLRCVGN